MIESIIVTAVFMIFQVFFLTRWLEKRESNKNKLSWTPFRKLMLDSLVNHAENLINITNNYENKLEIILEDIRIQGFLDINKKNKIVRLIESTHHEIDLSRIEFYNTVQTVAPSLQPYVAQYCNEVFWFGDSLLKSLKKSMNHILEIDDEKVKENEHTSHPLNGVWAMLASIKMYRDYRFSSFKKNFTQSVWKLESLHYYEGDGEFLPPEDFAKALDSDKSIAELNKIPRTTPIKSFFEKTDDGKA